MRRLIILLSVAILASILIVTNPKESDFVNKVENSSEQDYGIMNTIKSSEPIISSGKIYGKYFTVKRTNLLIFSIYSVSYGWFGNVNFAGLPVDKTIIKDGSDKFDLMIENKYIGCFGDFFRIHTETQKNFN